MFLYHCEHVGVYFDPLPRAILLMEGWIGGLNVTTSVHFCGNTTKLILDLVGVQIMSQSHQKCKHVKLT